MVWMRDEPKHLRRFHKSPDCWQLRKPPPKGGHHRELIEVSLDDIAARPCRTCYPDAPRIYIRKAYCPTCQSVYACEHNGGVQIIDRAGRHLWVWPSTNQMPLYRRTSQASQG